jgi:hypothetical protein
VVLGTHPLTHQTHQDVVMDFGCQGPVVLGTHPLTHQSHQVVVMCAVEVR